jgi:hypothetical protein
VAARARAWLLGAAVALAGCATTPAPLAFEPHLGWDGSDDAAWATAPALGVAPLADERPVELRGGWRPALHYHALGVERAGVERTGDADFDRSVADGVRGELVATLARASVFRSVRAVDFDPRDPAAWPEDSPPLVLTGTIEQFEGRQWHSFAVSPLRIGLVTESWGPSQGRVSLRIELYARGERIFETRVSTRHDAASGDAPEAVLVALALDAEKIALRLDARLRAERPLPPRALAVHVLDGCELGDAHSAQLVRDTSAIFEREAGIVLVGSRETWSDRPAGASLDELLEAAARVTPPPGGVVLALAPAQQTHELGLGSVRTGLSQPLGAHAVALCSAPDEVSVLTAAHELAHLFGAVHVRDAFSVMHSTSDFDARFFDPLNRRIVRSQRTRDFTRPLDPARSAQLAAIYREAEGSDQVDPNELDGALRALDELARSKSD